MQQAGFIDIVIKPFDFLHPAMPSSLIPLVASLGNLAEKLPLFKEIAGSLYISAKKV
jgi:hypothetical protein